ncbi:MAG: sigma-54 dependent transcriptional regulator [Myxococcota bacterium]|nr:sigma-54 dependent transcriptional regulator [Myxococcota bacterium]
MTEQAHVLVVDDELGILVSLEKIFQREGFRVTTTPSGVTAIELIRADESIGVVLTDIMMPKMNGIELIRAVKALSPAIEVIVMTAFGTVDNAVECMKAGAYDFITKPLKRAIVVRSVLRTLERRTLLLENLRLRRETQAFGHTRIVGQSNPIRHVLETIEQAAPSDATILITGQSGTGKELCAQQIHDSSERAAGPFVAINCAALPETLLESELFGHEKGAFTGATSRREGRFERANRGTLFLDEITELALPLQARLLRALQEQEIERLGGDKIIPVDARIVAATNRNLDEMVKVGLFREDLYYRLNVIQLELPSLCDRVGDVAILAQHFLTKFCAKNNKSIEGYTDDAMKTLDNYAWPGNVRELENVIERAVVLARGNIIEFMDLPPSLRQSEGDNCGEPQGEGVWIPFGIPMEDVEQRVIHYTLSKTDGDKRLTATLLKMGLRTIYRKIGE